jgi:cytochrome oxidase Cu insertion factor (SCO1/SenC/PrrC family)
VNQRVKKVNQQLKPSAVHPAAAKPRSKTPLVIIFLMSLAPVLAAVLVYFNPQWRPEGSVNYGQLVEPQRPMPASSDLVLTTLDGKPFDLNSLKGKWLLVTADGAACPDSCARKLFILRNSHASQGKNVERLARVWFITDDAPVPEKVLEAYKGTNMVRVRPEQLQKFLTMIGVQAATPEQALAEPMWIIDPNGNLIMQYPAEAEPEKVRKDISKLVYNSRIG